MKFAKVVFWIAGVWGILLLTPLYFMFDLIGRQDPPPITHPQFYYAFVSAAMVWQFVFFVIATDPARFRPMILMSVFEKLGYVLTVVVLYLQGRTTPARSVTALPDAVLAVLFIVAFLRVGIHQKPEFRLNVWQ
jgi:hypothetical protein